MSRKILILAGPNGAGKTTFAREFLPDLAQCPIFVNADLIAQGLSPFDPDRVAIAAGRIMVRRIAALAAARETFGFESTLSGLTYAARIPRWQQAGYRVSIFYLALATAELAVARVAARVKQGGHDVPERVVRRRFETSRRNFEQTYKHIADDWQRYDNSGVVPVLLDWGQREDIP